MGLYQWRPSGSFEARQINSSDDLDAWIASLTPNELVGEWMVFTDLTNHGVTDGQFKLTYVYESPGEGRNYATVEAVLGTWMLADRERPNLTHELDESFQRRFQPVEL